MRLVFGDEVWSKQLNSESRRIRAERRRHRFEAATGARQTGAPGVLHVLTATADITRPLGKPAVGEKSV
jgi:hypothetical protein